MTTAQPPAAHHEPTTVPDVFPPADDCELGDTPLANAVNAYLARQDRTAHPTGWFDNAHRWEPDDDERRPCCRGIRPPSRRWPWTLMHHCRTATHVARLYGVDATALRRAARDLAGGAARYVPRPDDHAPIDPSDLPEQPAPERKDHP